MRWRANGERTRRCAAGTSLSLAKGHGRQRRSSPRKLLDPVGRQLAQQGGEPLQIAMPGILPNQDVGDLTRLGSADHVCLSRFLRFSELWMRASIPPFLSSATATSSAFPSMSANITRLTHARAFAEARKQRASDESGREFPTSQRTHLRRAPAWLNSFQRRASALAVEFGPADRR